MADAVLEKQHVGEHLFSGVESGIAAALVVLAGLDALTDELLGQLVIIVVGNGVDTDLDGIQVRIGPDRADVVFLDLVVGGGRTAVGHQDRTGDFLVEHHAHLTLEPGDDVEIDDVDDVIAIELLLLVDGLRRGGTLEQGEDFFLLQLTLHVTLGTGLVGSDVGEHRLDAGERNMMDIRHNTGDPGHAALDELRLTGNISVIREQVLDVLDAVVGMHQSVRQTLHVIHVSQNGFLQGAAGFGFLREKSEVLTSELSGRVRTALKGIVSHSGILLIFFSGSRNQIIHNVFLLFIHGVNDILNGLFRTVSVLKFRIRSGVVVFHGIFLPILIYRSRIRFRLTFVGWISFRILLSRRIFRFLFLKVIVAMTNDRLLRVDTSLILGIFSMRQIHVLDKGLGICTSQNKTDFTDRTMHNVVALLLQLIGENRQRGNITMSDKLFAHVSKFGVIEQTIAIHAIRLIDQGSLADNGTRCIVTMVPDERNNSTVLMCECILANYSTISAQKIVLGRPALKIGITRTRTNVINIGHYVFPPSLEFLTDTVWSALVRTVGVC